MPQAFQYEVIEKAYKEVRYKAVITQSLKLFRPCTHSRD